LRDAGGARREALADRVTKKSFELREVIQYVKTPLNKLRSRLVSALLQDRRDIWNAKTSANTLCVTPVEQLKQAIKLVTGTSYKTKQTRLKQTHDAWKTYKIYIKALQVNLSQNLEMYRNLVASSALYGDKEAKESGKRTVACKWVELLEKIVNTRSTELTTKSTKTVQEVSEFELLNTLKDKLVEPILEHYRKGKSALKSYKFLSKDGSIKYIQLEVLPGLRYSLKYFDMR
jgi:hypothetical protein